MFMVISPAKKLDFDSPLPLLPAQTLPRFLDRSAELIHYLTPLSPLEIGQLMKVSDKIATLNAERYSCWQPSMEDPDNARAAALAFHGDTYQGLAFPTLTSPQMNTAQQRLRILSGLYGLLRPLDKIRAYRLEMGTRLATSKGNTLYDFWGQQLTQQLVDDMQQENSKLLVNLASQEYFKALDLSVFPHPVIHPVFEDEKNGQFKVISFYAKRARGMMAHWIIANAITRAEELRAFDVAGYHYAPEHSQPHRPVFRRQALHLA